MNFLELLGAIPSSFYSGQLYKDVAERWTKECFVYLLLLLGLLWIPTAVKTHVGIWQLTKWSEKIIIQLPKIEIKDGRVSTDAPGPLTIKLDDTSLLTGSIDTTGSVTKLENTSATFLLTQDHFFYKKNDVEQRSFDLSKIKEFQMDQVKARRWSNWFMFAAFAFLPPFILAFMYVYRIAQAAFYAVFGLIFNSLFKTNLSYFQLFKISTVAITPAVILGFIIESVGKMGAHVPKPWLLLFLIAMGYLGFGIKATKPVSEENRLASDQ